MPPVLQPILLEVLAHVPTDFFHCSYCEGLFGAAGIGDMVRRETRAAYPPQMLEEASGLAVWLQGPSARFGERLQVRIVDPQSLEGFKSLRYGVRRYPTFVVDRRTKVTGWQLASLERLLEDRVPGDRRGA